MSMGHCIPGDGKGRHDDLVIAANPAMETTVTTPPPGAPPPPRRAGGAVTVRGLDPALRSRLRVRAAHNDRSMEAEARAILEAALAGPGEDPTDLAAFARALFAPLGGVDLDPPPPAPAHGPPDPGARPSGAGTAPPPPPPGVTGRPRAAAGRKGKAGAARPPAPVTGKRRQ